MTAECSSIIASDLDQISYLHLKISQLDSIRFIDCKINKKYYPESNVVSKSVFIPDATETSPPYSVFPNSSRGGVTSYII